MKTKIKKCKFCKKDLKVYSKQYGGTFIEPYFRKNKRTYSFSNSEEGILFIEDESKHGVWFCNKCWEQINFKVKSQHQS